jgi:hypothetical protein
VKWEELAAADFQQAVQKARSTFDQRLHLVESWQGENATHRNLAQRK